MNSRNYLKMQNNKNLFTMILFFLFLFHSCNSSCCVFSKEDWKKECISFQEECSWVLCNDTYINILKGVGIQNDAYLKLAPEYVSAVLNINALQACGSLEVVTQLDDAEVLLDQFCTSFILSVEYTERIKIRIADFLKMYNEGEKGPYHCDSNLLL